MTQYLLISSRDPYEVRGVAQFYDLATDLKAKGHDVTLFMVQNGVLPARRSAMSESISKLVSAGVNVMADEFSLKERGIVADRMVEGVKSSALEVVIDQLADGVKTMWH
jgi:predicted peroxiredoxin